MDAEKFVDKYHSIGSFKSIWKEILLIALLNYPFLLYAKYNNFFIYIIPWSLTIIIFLIFTNLDMTKNIKNPEKTSPTSIFLTKLYIVIVGATHCYFWSLGFLMIFTFILPYVFSIGFLF